MIINEFPLEYQCHVVSADTETHTYVDGQLLSSDEINELFKERDKDGNIIRNQTWAREHVSVSAYAWLISDGHYFAWLETFDEFCEFCCQHMVDTVWWYNAKFDFAFIDYQLLTNGWTSSNDKKLKDKEFNSLHGDQGQRYKLTLCRSIHRRGKVGDRHARPHMFHNYDFMNFFGGGLAKNLKDFNVVDFDGNSIRKLEMDYQGEIDDNAIQYMRNDVDGLFHLVRIASEFLEKETSISLMSSNVKVMTAGGLAKRVFLETLYQNGDPKDNIRQFQKVHRMDVELDQFLREQKLYQGGKTIANKDYIGRWISKNIYYYDRNSMYPAEMSVMPDLVGGLLKVNKKYLSHYQNSSYQIIYEIENYHISLKDGALPVFYDPFLKDYVDAMECVDYNNRSFMIFDFELKCLSQFYEITCDIKNVYAIKSVCTNEIADFINKWYEIKATAKKLKNGVMQQFAKLILNSTYGKLSQNPLRIASHRELSQHGAVCLVEDDESIDESSLLSVIMGAYITAKARCALMNFMIEVCGDALETREHIFYCDTDSVQTDIEYKYPDAFKLGGWKLEEGQPFSGAKWLAPKTYCLMMIDKDTGERSWTLHSKGVQTKVLTSLFTSQTTIAQADEWFKEGRSFQTLCGLNVRGGKALLPFEKMLCRPDNINAVGENMIVDERSEI